MFNKKNQYLLFSIILFGFIACSSSPKTILIKDERVDRGSQLPSIVIPAKRAVIKEEILLGGKDKNISLGERIDTSATNPLLEDRIFKEDENLSHDDLGVVKHNEVIERIPFPLEEYKYIKKRGRSTVSGKIYLENVHTSTKIYGQKIKLWLNPVTSYSRQWYEESYLGGYKLSKADKRLYNYLKFTYSDRSGNFNFFGVPTGNYYLTGTISCQDECGFDEMRSIRLVEEIYVGRGVTKVELMKHVP